MRAFGAWLAGARLHAIGRPAPTPLTNRPSSALPTRPYIACLHERRSSSVIRWTLARSRSWPGKTACSATSTPASSPPHSRHGTHLCPFTPTDGLLPYQANWLPPFPLPQIHWLSIINSFVLVLLLTAFLAVILMRVLKNDVSRYMQMELDEDDIVEEEGGWKLIHGDVFRFPQVRAWSRKRGEAVTDDAMPSLCRSRSFHTAASIHPPMHPPIHSPFLTQHVNLFAAFMGSGAHLCVTTLLLLCCALGGVFRATKRGACQGPLSLTD